MICRPSICEVTIIVEPNRIDLLDDDIERRLSDDVVEAADRGPFILALGGSIGGRILELLRPCAAVPKEGLNHCWFAGEGSR
jgi:hypothetical protein